MSNTIQDASEFESIVLSDGTGLISGSGDPSVLGFTAPVTSLFYDVGSGDIFRKFNTDDLDWLRLNEPNMNQIRNYLETAIEHDHILIYDSGLEKWINSYSPPPPPGGGRIIQISSGLIPQQLGTTTIEVLETAPLISEGTEIWSQALTPVLANSVVKVTTSLTSAASNSGLELVIAIFRDGICVGAAIDSSSNNNTGQTSTLIIYDAHGDVGGIHTYSCRVGKNPGPGTWYVNALVGYTNPLAGNLSKNAYSLEEIAVL